MFQKAMHDAREFFTFMCEKIHFVCCEGQVCPTFEIKEKCLSQDNCVTHNIFSFEVEKCMLFTLCGTKSWMGRYVLWSHITFASRFRAATSRFKQNLATMYDVLLDYRIAEPPLGLVPSLAELSTGRETLTSAPTPFLARLG